MQIREGLLMMLCTTMGAALVSLLALTPAFAEPIVGACCLPTGACQELMADPCESGGGTYIGDGTDCEQIDCQASVAVPVLSIFGLIAMFGALGSLGIYGLVRRHRKGS